MGGTFDFLKLFICSFHSALPDPKIYWRIQVTNVIIINLNFNLVIIIIITIIVIIIIVSRQ